jgi:hypothetical protein
LDTNPDKDQEIYEISHIAWVDIRSTGLKYLDESDMGEVIVSYICHPNMKILKNGMFNKETGDYANTNKIGKATIFC